MMVLHGERGTMVACLPRLNGRDGSPHGYAANCEIARDGMFMHAIDPSTPRAHPGKVGGMSNAIVPRIEARANLG